MWKLCSFSLFLLLPRGGRLSSPGHKRQPPATGIIHQPVRPHQRFPCSATGRPNSMEGAAPAERKPSWITKRGCDVLRDPAFNKVRGSGWVAGSNSAEERGAGARAAVVCERERESNRGGGAYSSGSVPAPFFPGQASKQGEFSLGAEILRRHDILA